MTSTPNPKPVIPTPLALRWREFKFRTMPVIFFLAALIAAVIVWNHHVVPVSMVGRVESIQADVISPKPGLLTQLQVTRFQQVLCGDPIAQVITTDPSIVTASLAVIQAEVKLLQIGMAPVENSQRNAINYEQMRMDCMRQHVDLATDRVEFQQAVDDFQRADKLHREKLISEADFEAARSKQNALKAEVEEMEKLVTQTEQALQRLQLVGDAVKEPQNQLQAAIAVEEEKLRLTEAQLKPIMLKAPIDGMVSMIHRWNGENIAVGEPIVTISAMQSDRIIGYLRQPLTIRPRTNMAVIICTRGMNRHMAQGKILAVGAQLQPLNDVLVPPTRFNNLVELGLPILVSLPSELKVQAGDIPIVHPGELVDLRIVGNVW
jgi:multidrug resistance efflux pump